jgi:DNA repair exonuclease SbcCD ATPase subunit
MRDRIQTIQQQIDQAKGQLKKLKEQETQNTTKLSELNNDYLDIEQAQIIIQEVGKQTQEQVRYHIEDIVSLAIDSIFPNQYNFIIDFDIKRNKTEAEIYFIDRKTGCKIKPMDAMGGGIVDISSFALRVALWSLKTGKKNNTIILDEPMRFLSKDLQPKGAEMIKKLSEKLNIQFIIVTHNSEIVEYSDKVFEVKKINGISTVTEVM